MGATPIQNVGAYGQEVSDTLAAVRALDRESGAWSSRCAPAECGFGYRDSLFKSGEPGRYVVLAVTYRLVARRRAPSRLRRPRAPPRARGVAATLADVRETRDARSAAPSPWCSTRAIRTARSCGSFFLNPIVDAAALAARRRARGRRSSMPRWPQPDGRVKLSAAWLIERAGFARGAARGPGRPLHAPHARHRRATTARAPRDVAAFARRVRAGVEERFGVRLHPEPIFWGTLSLD